MTLLDVNVLVYSYRADATDHVRFRGWLAEHVGAPPSFGLTDLVLSSFLRIVTNPRVFKTPSPTGDALAFISAVRSSKNCVLVAPGPRHWDIFVDLCTRAGVRANLVPDAFLAALAIESGSEWITTDRDFARFPGLRWRHPLAP
ncbi:MAG: type II toxin-antitoxin system VapC family toxin [Myxococcota bacterium]